MKVEALKREARRKEQEEAWSEALQTYRRAAELLEEQDDPDIGLYNRMGDLELRLGRPDDALATFERAMDLYVDSGLLNNAIGVCNKLIRHLPERDEPHLRLGRLRAKQGFLADARSAFVTYAERRQARGEEDEALEALVEFADLVPDDHAEDRDVRQLVADRLAGQDRHEEAVEQYRKLRRSLLAAGEAERADEVAGTIRELDPEATLEEEAEERGPAESAPAPGSPEGALLDLSEPAGEAETAPVEEYGEDHEKTGEYEEAEEDLDAVRGATPEGGALLTQDDLPSMDADDQAGGEDERGPQGSPSVADEADEPPVGGDGADEGEVDALDPGGMVLGGGGEAPADAGTGEASPAPSQEEEVGEATPPDDAPAPGDASERPAKGGAAASVGEETGGYVDLGALVLGEEEEKDTRMKVPTQTPTGDEEADFARMLEQFKEKVARNLEEDNARDHHDLGTAYRGMGLLDEAIAQLQKALRADPESLPTYEVLGQCFLDKGEPRAAIQLLERAIRVPTHVDDDRIGMYYDLGRAHEEVGNVEQAREFYERVFALDINFKDVTDRLRRVRTGQPSP